METRALDRRDQHSSDTAAGFHSGSTDEAQRIQETAIVQLGGIYKALKRADDLANLITESYAFFGALPKAKSAKLGAFWPN